MNSEQPWRLALIGASLGHSASPKLFADLFKASGVEGSYDLLPFPDADAVQSFLTSPDAGTFDGFNVTVPYKALCAALCDALTPRAAAIGAVNVLLPKAGGGFVGDNTDGVGFMESIRPFLASQHERALILGRGGAAMAAAHGLQTLGIDVVHLVRDLDPSPSPQRLELRFADLKPEVVQAFLLVVQATPVGMWPNVEQCPPFLYEMLGEAHLCVDLVYNPPLTAFLKKAQGQGATILNGQGMLTQQASGAWKAFQLNRLQRFGTAD